MFLDAYANPGGPNAAILTYARIGVDEPVVLDSALAEVRRNLTGRFALSRERADEYLRIVLGGSLAASDVAAVINGGWRSGNLDPATPLRALIVHLLEAAGRDPHPALGVPSDVQLRHVSAKDLHVVVGAVIEDAEYIVTSHYDDFPPVPLLPKPRPIQPRPFLRHLGVLHDS